MLREPRLMDNLPSKESLESGGVIAVCNAKEGEESPRDRLRDMAEEKLVALALARDAYQSIILDTPIHEILAEWDLEELWAGLDKADDLALQKFTTRRRIIQVIQAGLKAERVAITRYGPDRQPDHAARATWLKILQKFNMGPKALKGEKEIVPAGPSEADFFAGLKGKPAVRKRIMERLAAMDRAEGTC